MPPTAIVMNMFYTGLGIARSLGEFGVPVVGLSARRGIFGNFTRYASIRICPDSRDEPEALLTFLLHLGSDLKHRPVLFPTRDHDLVFLDRFRDELSPCYRIVMPGRSALYTCLDKERTYQWAVRAGVSTPRCWTVQSETDIQRIASSIPYPCVVKPVAAHHWRLSANWDLVGARKAIAVSSPEELLSEYALIARADKRALIQELVPGGDDCLVIVACYLDESSNIVAAFNTRKVLQIPSGFGTGCIVQTTQQPELLEPTARLLKSMRYTGIAEVEYKWNSSTGKFQLIEVNPRPWDQHRLGNASGVDLIQLAYCEHTQRKWTSMTVTRVAHKWIAEDTFVNSVMRMAWRRDPAIRSIFQLAKGKRIYALWSAKDPLPSIVHWVRFVPQLVVAGARVLWNAFTHRTAGKGTVEKEPLYDARFAKHKSHG